MTHVHKRRRLFRSVRTQLLSVIALILLLPSLAIGGFAYITAKDQVDGQLEIMARTDMTLVDSLIDQYISAKMSDVRLLSGQTAEQLTGGRLGEYAKEHAEAEATVYVPADGAAVAYASDGGASEAADAKNSAYYAMAQASKGDTVLSEPYTSAATGHTVVALAQASKADGSVVAVVLDLSGLKRKVGSVKVGQTGFVIVFSAKGASIVPPPWGIGGEAADGAGGTEVPASGQASDAPDSDAAGDPPADGGAPTARLAGDSGQVEQTSPDGETRNLIFTTNALTGWKVAADRSPSEVTRTAAPILSHTALVIAISLLAGAIAAYFIVRAITRPLRALSDVSRAVSEGDLSRRVAVKSRDEFGELGASFDRMVDSLQAIVAEVGRSANRLAASSGQLSASAGQTASATEHIADTMERMADGAAEQAAIAGDGTLAIRDVSEQIRHIADSASRSAEATGQAASRSSEGGQAIQDAVRQMGSISGSVDGLAETIRSLTRTSAEIGDIVEVIAGLSQQTNLLALNAAIEAARAGEQGRGFAVVASEVRKLAELSAKSTDRVGSLIAAVHDDIVRVGRSMQTASGEVSDGVDAVRAAGRLFAEIERDVGEIDSQVRGVSAAAERMAAGTAQVVRAIEEIAGGSRETAADVQAVSAAAEQQLASMQEISSSSSALSRMAVELQQRVDKFNV